MMYLTVQTLFDHIDLTSAFPDTIHHACKTDIIRYTSYEIIHRLKCSSAHRRSYDHIGFKNGYLPSRLTRYILVLDSYFYRFL